jgi:hypothetical protein
MFSQKIHLSLHKTCELLKANTLHHCLPEALPECCSKPLSHHGSSTEKVGEMLKETAFDLVKEANVTHNDLQFHPRLWQ